MRTGASERSGRAQTPIGCQTVLVSRTPVIRSRPGSAVQSGSAAGRAAYALEVGGGLDLEGRGLLRVAGEPGEVDGVDVHVRGERDGRAVQRAGEDVDDPARHVGGREHLGERDGRQRAVGRRGHHDGVAGDDDRGDDADEPEQAGLLRREHGDDPGRLGRGEVEERPGDRVGVADDLGELVGPPGVPDQAVDRVVERPVPAAAAVRPSPWRSASTNWERRSSITSATR